MFNTFGMRWELVLCRILRDSTVPKEEKDGDQGEGNEGALRDHGGVGKNETEMRRRGTRRSRGDFGRIKKEWYAGFPSRGLIRWCF